MALREGTFARVWSAKPNGKTYSCNVSVSRKNQQTGEYETQFSGYVNFAGAAAEKVATLGLPEQPDRDHPASRPIRIASSPDISTWYNKQRVDQLLKLAGNNDTLVRFIRANCNTMSITVWDIEIDPPSNSGGRSSSGSRSRPAAQKPSQAPKASDEQGDPDDDLPF